MFNSIKELIDLEDDPNVIILKFKIENHSKIITVEYKFINVYCSSCSTKIHVKDHNSRYAKHNILQNGYQCPLFRKETIDFFHKINLTSQELMF